MNNYDKLRGLPVEFINHPQGLTFQNCFLADISDAGLTIFGEYEDNEREIYCLDLSFGKHYVEFPIVVEMIITEGIIDCKKLPETRKIYKNYTGQAMNPKCIFKQRS